VTYNVLVFLIGVLILNRENFLEKKSGRELVSPLINSFLKSKFESIVAFWNLI